LDLVGAAVDRRGEGLADLDLHPVLAGVAVPTHELDGLERGVLRRLGAADLRGGAVAGQLTLVARVEPVRDVVQERPAEAISVARSAIRCRTAWKLPMGRPNCSRCLTYASRSSNERCAAPTLDAAMIRRSTPRPRLSWRHAPPTVPTTAATGTRTPVK